MTEQQYDKVVIWTEGVYDEEKVVTALCRLDRPDRKVGATANRTGANANIVLLGGQDTASMELATQQQQQQLSSVFFLGAASDDLIAALDDTLGADLECINSETTIPVAGSEEIPHVYYMDASVLDNIIEGDTMPSIFAYATPRRSATRTT